MFPCILWIDPGTVTGFAWLVRGQHFNFAERDFRQAGSLLWGMCTRWKTGLAAGWERFDIDATTHKKTPDGVHDALNMIGVARWISLTCHVHILPPASRDQRLVSTPQMLKTLGWWPSGRKDAQAASQHLLAYLLRSGTLPQEFSGKLFTDNR